MTKRNAKYTILKNRFLKFLIEPYYEMVRTLESLYPPIGECSGRQHDFLSHKNPRDKRIKRDLMKEIS